jgi:hypothetical protein
MKPSTNGRSITLALLAIIPAAILGIALASTHSDAAGPQGNLRGAFKRLGEAHPLDHDTSFQEMIASITEQPFKALDNAIKSKDEIGFSKAYTDLTDGCLFGRAYEEVMARQGHFLN